MKTPARELSDLDLLAELQKQVISNALSLAVRSSAILRAQELRSEILRRMKDD